MSKLTLNDVTNIGSITVINDNFDKIEQALQTKVLYRNNPSGEPNMMENDIDMNGKNILNVGDVFSTMGRWATIDEVEDIRDKVAANAVTVATNKDIAVASANSAATSYDNFDDRYLGQKASDPSVDNDGGLLLTGALYFRTSGTPIMRVYNGTTWQDVGSITTTTTNLIDPPLYSSQAEAEAGANNTKVMTPLRAKNAIDAQVKGGFTSTGAITLPGNAANALEAVPRQQAEVIAGAAAASAVSNRMQYSLLAAASTGSGPSVDVTSIPAWATRITVLLNGVSTNGTFNPLFQLGSGSYATSGYAGSQTLLTTGAATGSLSGGFSVGGSGAVSSRCGSFVFTHQGSNAWVCSGSIGFADSPGVAICGGVITLAGTLDRLRLFAGGTDQFDGGGIRVLIEG